MSTPTYCFGAVAAAALGVFLLSGPVVHAWTDAEIAHCSKSNKDGRVFTPLGYGSKGGPIACQSTYTDPTWTPQKEQARWEAARRAEIEWIRKGGKPDGFKDGKFDPNKR